MEPMKRFPLLICASVAVGIVTSCASSPAVAPTTAPQESPAATRQTDQDTEAERASPDADPLTCLHGTWLADNAFFLERIQEFGDEVHGVSGRVILHFAADGTLTTEYQDWIISAVTEGMEVQIIRAGVDRGTYTISGQTLDLHETDIGSTLTMKRGSLEMPIDPHPAVYDGAAYSCGTDDATIETIDGALGLTRQ